MVARALLGWGVLPSGIITSHMTRAPFFLVESGKTATGLSMQSELCPSACLVELPSKPHIGSSASVGKVSNSLTWVLPRRFATGVYPSSQIYSNLYFAIWVSEECCFGFYFRAPNPPILPALDDLASRMPRGKILALTSSLELLKNINYKA